MPGKPNVNLIFNSNLVGAVIWGVLAYSTNVPFLLFPAGLHFIVAYAAYRIEEFEEPDENH